MGGKGKYSKNKLVGKRIIAGIVILLIALLVLGISFIIYVNVTNNIIYENVKTDSSSVNDDVASKSSPIIINNIILGATYNEKWVSMERYYFKSTNKESYDVDIFTRKGKTGTFKLNDVERSDDYTAAYTTTTRTNYQDEYYAVKSESTLVSKMDKIPLTEKNIPTYQEHAKKALGLYGMLNETIKIREVYEVAIVPGEISYVITATNDGKTNNGVYSAVIFVSNLGKVSLVKYNYVKDVNKSENFAVYTTKFIADLNGDKKSEIILQETTEFKTKYSVMEYINGKFYEVLSATINS